MASLSPNSRAATASYIETMLSELRSMSQGMDADFLGYLIEMAMIEASDIASGKTSTGRVHTQVVEKITHPDAEQLASLYLSGALK